MNRVHTLLLGCCFSLLAGCAAQAPTHYYDLSTQAAASTELLSEQLTLGIGPVTLPQLLDRPGIVSHQHQTQVKVASYHIWAGELEAAFTNVLAASIGTTLQHESVWPFPWDNRFRPQYQVRIFVERFSGELNGPVSLNLTWTLLGDYGQRMISTHRYRATLESNQGYNGYVNTLNQLLADFASELSASLSKTLADP